MAWVWIRLSAAGKEPSTPMKFAWGLVFAGLGFAILVLAGPAEGQLASPLWLTATYFLHTIGELLLSPVGLSAMTMLAPGADWRLDDGRVVPGHVRRQFHQRPRLRAV